MNVGQRIKERRIEIGMSADKLAECLGKNRSTIYRYESGDIENMPLDILEPIAKALRTTPVHLMGWDQDEIDAVSGQVAESNEYYDAKEQEISDFLEEMSEMHLTSDNIESLRTFANGFKEPQMNSVIKHFKRLYELHLTDEEIEEIYSFALYVKSKREK